MSCGSPLTLERLVAYWTDDLDPVEATAVEEHLFSCASCAANAERVARIAQAFRTQLPPVISSAELEALRARGVSLVEHTFEPDRPETVTFEPQVELLVHRLGGLDLRGAERVEVVVRSESAGVLFEEPIAPFDRERGEVLIACHRHFEVFPRDIAFDVRVHRPAAPADVATYFIPHVFL